VSGRGSGRDSDRWRGLKVLRRIAGKRRGLQQDVAGRGSGAARTDQALMVGAGQRAAGRPQKGEREWFGCQAGPRTGARSHDYVQAIGSSHRRAGKWMKAYNLRCSQHWLQTGEPGAGELVIRHWPGDGRARSDKSRPERRIVKAVEWLAEAETGLTGVVADRRASCGKVPERTTQCSLFRSSHWTELCLVPTAAGLQPNSHIL